MKDSIKEIKSKTTLSKFFRLDDNKNLVLMFEQAKLRRQNFFKDCCIRMKKKTNFLALEQNLRPQDLRDLQDHQKKFRKW